jgi:hypothetical protein
MSFNPYHKWLGIPPEEQPADHYRLLGIARFESDPDVVETAADQRMGHLRMFQTGQHSALSQKLLNELATAKLCLLTPEKKVAYDAELRRRFAAPQPTSAVLPVGVLVSRPHVPVAAAEPAPLFVAESGPRRRATKKGGSLSSRSLAWLILAAVALPVTAGIGYLVMTNASADGQLAKRDVPATPIVPDSNTKNPRKATGGAQQGQHAGNPEPTPPTRSKTPTLVDRGGNKTSDGGFERPPEPKAGEDPERRAAEYVLSVGGKVRINDEEKEITASTELPNTTVRLTSVDLGDNQRVTEAGLAAFHGTKNLKRIVLYRCTGVSDTSLANFKENTNLEDLGLWPAKISIVGLRNFKDCAKLRHMDLGCCITNDDMIFFKDFSGLRSLEFLQLHGTSVRESGLANLKGADKLVNIYLAGSSIADDDLRAFANNDRLRILGLTSTAIGDGGIAHLRECRSLQQVSLERTKVTADGVKSLKRELPGCKITWDGGDVTVEAPAMAKTPAPPKNSPPKRPPTNAPEAPPSAKLTAKNTGTLKQHTAAVTRLAFHRTSPLLASAGKDGQVLLWNLQAGGLPLQLHKFAEEVWAIKFSPDGSSLAFANRQWWGSRLFFKTVAGVQLNEVKGFKNGGGAVASIAYSPDGRLFAAGQDDGTIRLWDIGQFRELTSIGLGDGHNVYNLAFGPATLDRRNRPTGYLLAEGGQDGLVRTYRATIGNEGQWSVQQTDVQFPKAGAVLGLRFSHDGKLLGFTRSGGHVCLCDPQGQNVRDLAHGGGSAEWIAFHPKNPWCVTAHKDAQAARIWNTDTGEFLCELKGHTGGVMCAEFSPDGRRVATASEDFSIKLWELSGPGVPGEAKRGKKTKTTAPLVGD